ncbi:hypothetical protein GZ77_13550 [Endozoicomonas montiporae]|uniref:FHA domain-containing protein n=2 Tax=Endozoicomonas montiporae TaxID=1027273 RepID=A0A081N4N2_9GAMM|nr:FHA domain-containing protein [Endozoicomonas montiporae]AMO57716.1 hypothetical protein EZMO1_3764 [Endozoicomonas montiporae CL-33]KEQ13405.1 hypothetical protein GZ77_13550 [Endozoicomonas montiporae]
MQLMIISLPASEQVANLNHSLNADELFIGQSESCQIRLPDRQNLVTDQHIRLIREDSQWYVENLSDHPLRINQVEVPERARQRMLLSDGDIIFCGDYQLAASDFSPWLGSSDLLEPPDLVTAQNQTPDYCVLPTTSEEHETDLNDPFALEPVTIDNTVKSEVNDWQKPQDDTALVELSPSSTMSHVTSEPVSSQSLQSRSSLIDVLSEADELDNDWNIHRGLWYGKITQPQEPAETCFHSPLSTENTDSTHPVVTRIPRIFSPPADAGKQSKSTSRSSGAHQRSICQAMLSALDQTMADFSPDQLLKQFKRPMSSSPVTDTSRTKRIRHYLGCQPRRPERNDFQNDYQHFYQQLMTSKQYRLLFLQRFRQALKEQEHPVGDIDLRSGDINTDGVNSDDVRSNDDGT